MIAISVRRLLAAGAILLGALAAVAGDPYPRHPEPTADSRVHSDGERRMIPLAQTRLAANHTVADVSRLATAIAHEEDHITALELAAWIRDRKPGLRIIDLRSAGEFEKYHLPHAERVALESLAPLRFRPDQTIVLISDGGAHAAQAWVLLEVLGCRQLYFLRGGLHEWLDDVMNPVRASNASPVDAAAFAKVAELSRYFGGVPRVSDATHPATIPPTTTSAATASIRRRGC